MADVVLAPVGLGLPVGVVTTVGEGVVVGVTSDGVGSGDSIF